MSVSTSAVVLTVPSVIAVAGGYYHALAALGDGTVAAWGMNRDGQGGTYDSNNCVRGQPCLLAPRPVAGLPAILAVAGGGDHSLALATNGMVWAWGANYSGQLGGPVDQYGTEIPTQVPGLTDVVAIAAGYEHSLALKADGTVWAWGVNTDGTLGATSADQCGRASAPYACAKSPVRVPGLTGVVALAGGAGYHSLALHGDGTVWAWGRNREGQLGVAPGPVCDQLACSRVPVQVPGLTGVAALGVGEFHSLVARSDGTVWAWGDNSYGMLGDGTTAGTLGNSCACRPTPAPVAGLAGATAVVAGSSYGAARTADGGVWVWGANSSGESGDGGTVGPDLTPRRVAGLGAATALAGGSQSVYALLADGALWDWGSEYNAELGRGTFGNAPRPPGPVAFPSPAPRLAASPTGLTFGPQALNTTSAAQTVTLSNVGAIVATLGAVTTSGDFAQTNACPATLATGNSCTFSVTFTPTAAGASTGALSIASDAVGSPFSIPLGGTGSTAPALTLSPVALAFPDQSVGQASGPRVVTLSNTGTAPIALGARTIVGTNPTEFAITATTCGATLGASNSCTITLTFTPAAAGQRTATLQVADDAPGNPHTVPLSGRGVQPEIALSPASLTFPKQALGTTSSPRNVTVTNTGSGQLTISALNADGDFRIDNTQTCLGTVQPGASCILPVLFTPTVVGLRTGTLTITDNAPGSPHTVALNGSGPMRGFIFVHGIGEQFTDYDPSLTAHTNDSFAKVLVSLQGQYRGNGTYVAFRNYEDKGSSICTQQSLPPFTVPQGFPLTFHPGPPICDSNDDIGLNAILLDQQVRLLTARGVDRVTIVANSMGGAITRAYLAYATATQSPSLSAIDGIMFLQGAHHGSYLGRINQLGVAALTGNRTTQQFYSYAASVAQSQNIDLTRPALEDLTPGSAMYQFVNQPQYVPANLAYLNVAAEITLQPYSNILGVNVNLASIQFGDFVMMPGNDNPAGSPPLGQPFLGGARFRPANAASAAQVILPNQARIRLDRNTPQNFAQITGPQPRPPGVPAPQSHFMLDGYLTQIPVSSTRSLRDELLFWIHDLDRRP